MSRHPRSAPTASGQGRPGQADALLELATLPELVRGQHTVELHVKLEALYQQLRRIDRRGREEVV